MIEVVLVNRQCERLLAMDRPYWNQDRKKLFSWIKENGSKSFADLYQGAVINLFERIPGHVRFVSHAARDIMNGMARHKLGIENAQVPYASLVNDLLSALSDDNILLHQLPPIQNQPPSKAIEESHPKVLSLGVIAALQKLFDVHEAGKARNAKSPFIFFEAYLPQAPETELPPEAFIKEWKALHKWFLKNTHERGSLTEGRSSELESKFVQLEQIILAFAQRYKQSLEKLDAILDQANK